MQETHRGIEADAFGGAAAIVRQQRIEERQQRVDRIERRAAAAAVEADIRVGSADKVREYGEVAIGRFAFRAAQGIGAVVADGDAAQDALLAGRSSPGRQRGPPRSSRRRDRAARAAARRADWRSWPRRCCARSRPAGSEARYCARRSSTLPLTGPSTRASKRPWRSSSTSVMPARARAPIKGGDTKMPPNTTTAPSMCSGTRPRSAPSTSATRFSPSLRRLAPSVVT